MISWKKIFLGNVAGASSRVGAGGTGAVSGPGGAGGVSGVGGTGAGVVAGAESGQLRGMLAHFTLSLRRNGNF